MPRFVVEVLSKDDREVLITHKIRGYLTSGAEEVAMVAFDGRITYHRAGGAHARSALGVELELPAGLFAA